MKNLPIHKRSISARSISEEHILPGVSIDGYKIEFTTKVALIPVDLVAIKRDENPQKSVTLK